MEGIVIPEYITDLSEINSDNIKFFLDCYDTEQSDISNRVIPLEYLRSFYLEHREKFYPTVNELSFRGFTINSDKGNNIFPKLSKIKYENIITVAENKDEMNYKKIPFERFGLWGSLKQFSIQRDDFFEGIPLENFIYINKNMDLNLLKIEFEKNHFQLKKYVVYSKATTTKKVMTAEEKINSQSFSIDTQNDVGSIENGEGLVDPGTLDFTLSNLSAMEFYLMDMIFNEMLSVVQDRLIALNVDITVRELYFLESQEEFICYCDSHNINYVNQLQINDFVDYFTINNLSKEKMLSIWEKIKDFLDAKSMDYMMFSSYEMLKKAIENNELLGCIDNTEVFKENSFNMFIKYCQNNELKKLEDITFIKLKEYSRMKGVGPSKIQDIVHKIQDYIFKQHELIETNEQTTEGNSGDSSIPIEFIFRSAKFNKYCHGRGKFFYDDTTVLHVRDMARTSKAKKLNKKILGMIITDCYNQNDKFIELASGINSINIDRINGLNKLNTLREYMTLQVIKIPINPLLDEILDVDLELINNTKLEIYNESIQLFLKGLHFYCNETDSIDSMFLNFSSSLEEKDRLIFQKRVITEDETLDKVGESVDLTRERVRQIAKSIEQSMGLYLKEFGIDKKVISDNRISESSEVIDLHGKNLCSENDKLIGYYKKYKLQNYNYSETLDIFYEKSVKFEIADLEKKLFNIGSFINIDISYLEFSESYEKLLNIQLSSTKFSELIRNLGYKYDYEKYISKNKLSSQFIISSIFEQYFYEEELRTDNDGVVLLNNLALDEFGLSLYENEVPEVADIRNIRAILDRCSEVIKVGPATYKYKMESIDKSLLNEIKDYLHGYFVKDKELDVINIKKVFQQFENELGEKHISIYQLYYNMKEKMSDVLDFGKGNTMNIYLKNTKKLTSEEILCSVLEKSGGIINRDEAANLLGWENYTIDQTISKSSQLKMREGIITKIDYNFKPTNLNKHLEKVVKAEIKLKGYIMMSPLFNSLQFNDEYNSDLKELGIKDETDLCSYIKFQLDSLEGHTKFLCYKGKNLTLLEIVLKNIDKPFSRNDLLNLISSFGYTDQTYYSILQEGINNNDFTEIDDDLMVPVSKVYIKPSIQDEVLEYLKDEIFNSQDFYALTELKGYKYRFPAIDYEWTPYIIKHIASEHGYKAIKRKISDYRYDRLIMVKPNSAISSFAELVHQVLSTYDGNSHQSAVYEYLQQKGLLNEKEYITEKKLPSELVEEKVISVDELGFVSWNN